MYSLFCEAKFWTLRDDIYIRDTDFGAVSYHDKKDIVNCAYQEGKRSYCEKRGATVILSNKRPLKLKDALKDLEHYLASHKIVFHTWKNDSILQLVLNTGIIVNVGISIYNGDLSKITFDKYLVGKLLSENITDVVSTRTHLVVSYNENQLTLINYNKPSTRLNLPEKLARLDPKIQHVELSGPSGRRLERKLSASVDGDMILTWWHLSRNEFYPWSPLVKDEDRANVHIYSLRSNKIELLCYYRTEFDQISVNFSRKKNKSIWLVEQKVSKKGDVTVEYSSYEIEDNFLKKIAITSIPLPTQVCCHSLSPDEEKLFIGCIDGSLILFDESRGMTRIVKTSLLPNLVSWHNDGSLIMVANERGQFQCFDVALSCVRAQLLSEDLTPSRFIDLASYFKPQPTLVGMKWKKKTIALYHSGKFIPSDNFLLLIFEGGPLGILNMVGGGGLLSDNHRRGLTSDVVIRQYLLWNQVDKAINLLLSLNWNTNGDVCLAGLYHIVNFILRYPLTAEKEIQLETALGSFHVPLRPLNRATENEYGDQVHDLTRRFFHHLLRYQLYEKAFRLAIDLNDSDLFADFYHCAKSMSNEEMANAARTKFEDIVWRSENSSDCSHSTCSCSVSSEATSSDNEVSKLPPLPQVSVKKLKNSKIPPLPDLNRHNKPRESSYFNRNSIFIHGDSINPIPEERPSELSNSLESVTASTSFSELNISQSRICQDLCSINIPSEQMLPHETRTSFCHKFNSSTFTPHEFEKRQRKLNVIEKLYDLPAESKASDLHNELIYNRSMSFENIDSRNIRNDQLIYEPKIGRWSSDLKFSSDISQQFHLSSLGSLDNLKKPVQKPEGRSILLKQPTKVMQGTPLSKGFLKPLPHLMLQNKYNDTSHFKPLSGLSYYPTILGKQCLKTTSSGGLHTKQKVKFSDTVTQIMVPDISNLSVEEESSLSEPEKKSGSARAIDMKEPLNDMTSNYVRNENHVKNFQKSQDCIQVNEENSGTIKVIHFGVV